MWGNALGWCISAVMVLATAGGITWLNNNMETISARTEFSKDSSNGAAIALPVSPLAVLPSMTDPTDAGPIYHRAIEAYLSNPAAYGRFSRAGRIGDIQDLPGVRILLEATRCSRATLFADKPALIVNFNSPKQELDALRTLGECARQAGQLTEKVNPTEALKMYEALFSLGAKMVQERLTYEQFDAGLTMLAQGSRLIQGVAMTAGDSARVEACTGFDAARAEYVKQRIQPMQRVLSSADQQVLEQHAGDVFYFARSAEDRMWRVEAIFKLGRYRFNAGRIGDQSNAMVVIRELLNDPDPVIQAAAMVSRDMTQEQYRMLR
jgi:hypothetical protein